jgi:UTP--glucose-1-phosphate uridylyltransferase
LKIRKAIIPAAGLGTRFLPATKAQSKAMFPIVDKPAIQYVVEEAIASGIEEIYIIIGRSDEAIRKHFKRSYALEKVLEERNKYELKNALKLSYMKKITFVHQEHPRGLGDAISCARPFINEDESFAVLLCDDLIISRVPCLKQLIHVFELHRYPVIGVLPVEYKDVHKYGVILPKSKIRNRVIPIRNLVEKPSAENAPSQYAIMGRYILPPQIFEMIEKTPPDINDEVQLTDALIQLNDIQDLVGYRFEGQRFDVGDKVGFIDANINFALQRKDTYEGMKEILYNKECASIKQDN